MKLKTLTLVLIILTVGVSAAAEKQDKEYFAVLINGEKAGHGTHSRVVEDNKVRTTEDVTMTIKRGGIAVGVASDEVRRFGLNPVQRRRLIRAGADLIIPDFSQIDRLLPVLGFE